MCVCLTVVFLFKEGPQLVGSLLGRVLVLWELALLLLRDQLKYRLGRSSTQTNVYKWESLRFSFVFFFKRILRGVYLLQFGSM